MPDSNRAMASLIQNRIRNYATSRPEAGVRAHGAAYHARRTRQMRMDALAQQEARLKALEERLDAEQSGPRGIEAWMQGVSSATTTRQEDAGTREEQD